MAIYHRLGVLALPIAKVYLPEKHHSHPEQRREIVKGIHEVILTVEKSGHSAKPNYVQINKVQAGDWSFSGNVYEPRAR